MSLLDPLGLSSARPILQITPPTKGGVSDYAALLQSEWRRSRTAETIAVSGPGSLSPDRVPVSAEVIVHMSGYGYAHRGLCGWLASDIKLLKQQRPDVRVTIIFHELFAFGPPWRSAFWTHLPQRWIVERLARLADRVITNCAMHQARLSPMTSTPILMRPVFSNVCEPSSLTPWADRNRRIVVFGSETTRARALRNAQAFISSTDIEIVEVGSGNRTIEAGSGRHWLGSMPMLELSAVLSRSMFGLFGQHSSCAQKSSVFAAYAAHGCIPVLHGGEVYPSDLTQDRHFITTRLMATGLDSIHLNKISLNLYNWYQEHTISIQANEFLHYIERGTSGDLELSDIQNRNLIA